MTTTDTLRKIMFYGVEKITDGTVEYEPSPRNLTFEDYSSSSWEQIATPIPINDIFEHDYLSKLGDEIFFAE